MNDHPSSLGLSSVEPLPAESVLAPTARCSFCGLGEGEVARLFQGRAGYICDECVEVCLTLLADYRALGLAPPEPKRSWYQRWFGEEETVACSFTPHDQENPQGERLFASPGIQICEQCVAACAALKYNEGLETGFETEF